MSQKWQGRLSLGNLLEILPHPYLQATRMLLQYPQRDVHKDFNDTVPVGQKHIKKSAFPEQHSAVLAAEDVRACIFRGGSADNPPSPNHKCTDTLIQAPASLTSKEEGFRGTH